MAELKFVDTTGLQMKDSNHLKLAYSLQQGSNARIIEVTSTY